MLSYDREIRLINVLFRGCSQYGKHQDCRNRKLYYPSTICFFQGRMLCNDVSYVEILFMAEDWVTSYGQQSVSEVQKVKYFS